MVAVKPNLVGSAPHPSQNRWPSQNPLAGDHNSTKNLDGSLSSVVGGISRCDLSYPKSQGTHPPEAPVLHSGSRRRVNVLFKADAPHLEG